jgi:hypothetical protein
MSKSDNNSPVNTKTIVVAGAIAALVGGVAYYGASTGVRNALDEAQTAGTIVPAERYRGESLTSEDVTLGDQEIQSLLQTDEFASLIADPDFAALMADGQFKALAADGAFRALSQDGRWQALMASGKQLSGKDAAGRSALQADGRWAQLASDGRYAKIMADGRLPALMANANFAKLSADGRFQAFMADSRAARAFSDARHLNALQQAIGAAKPVAMHRASARTDPRSAATGPP